MVAAAREHTLTPGRLRVQLPRPSGLLALDVLVQPLTPGAHGAAVAALFITDPDSTPSLTNQILAERFGLTPMEAKVANALAQGLSVKAIAEACRLSTQTTRWYVKQVLAKTGTSRQAEVVCLLLSLMASSVNTDER
jgi:DNA-binding NarL/FixJ family response regulator